MSRRSIRAFFLIILIILLSVTVLGILSADSAADNNVTTSPAYSSDSLTVISTQWNNDQSQLLAFTQTGETYYSESNYGSYWDVDPVPNTTHTVLFSATDELRKQCPQNKPCTRNSINRVNLSTGKRTTLFTQTVPGHFNNEWHDVDRVSKNIFIVADMENNRVFLLNTTTGLIKWEWQAQAHFDIKQGGSSYFGTGYPEDWTHINDVEVLSNGQIMVSVRNFDQVVFLNRSTGVINDWTLGKDNNYEILNEQHNPDYIPVEQGGPAVIVADSHNNRVVEYQRSGSEWTQSWEWQDSQLVWPRDADRLPNGHTLVTDTNGDRVLELNKTGGVVWSVDVEGPYEAERLDTGPESQGGPSAQSASLVSRQIDGSTGQSSFSATRYVLLIKNILPNWVVITVLYVIPPWFTAGTLIYLLSATMTLMLWGSLELRWRASNFMFRLPVKRR
jgi:hypothetical protein